MSDAKIKGTCKTCKHAIAGEGQCARKCLKKCNCGDCLSPCAKCEYWSKWEEKESMRVSILVIGDSWASAQVGGTNIINGGWPLILDIPGSRRQAISGTTAQQWNANHNGMLQRAMSTEAGVSIISLMGNDLLQALSDGTITDAEKFTALYSMRCVVTQLRRRRTIVLLYADPYCGNKEGAAEMVAQLNDAIKVACACLGVEFFKTADVLLPAHFDGVDIHPNDLGQQAIADGLAKMLRF